MRRLNQIEILRFIGAIVVLMFHTARETTFFYKLPIILQNGPAWVYFYFLLSGYMLTYGFYHKKDFKIKEFYISRVLKLYPAYFFSLLFICIFISGFRGKEKMVYHLFLIQDWIFTRALNYNAAAWYISALAFLYLLFPIFLKLFQKYTKSMIVFSFISLFYSYYLYLSFYSLMFHENSEKVHQLFNYFPIMHIPSFIVGISLCIISFKIKERKMYSYLSIFYIGLLSFFMNNIPQNFIYAGSIVTLSFVPLLLFFAKDIGFFSKILGNTIFVFLGSISYTIYIFHVPLQELFQNIVTRKIDNNYFIIYFILTILFSILIFYFVENIFRHFLIKKILKK